MARLVPVEESGPRLVPVEEGGEPSTKDREPMSGGEIASGVGQTLLTMGTGAAGEIVGGIAGLLRGAGGGILGEEDIMSNMADTIEFVRESITVEPFTESGQRVAGSVSDFVDEYYFSKAREKGREDFERTGSPVVGTATQAGMEFLPALVGVRGVSRVPRSRIKDITDFAKEEGINIRRRGEGLREEVAAAGRKRADPARGQSAEGMKSVVDTARTEAKRNVDQQWDDLRSRRAGVPTEEALGFVDLAKNSVKDFSPLDDMPKVQKRIRELEDIKNLPRDSSVTLRAIIDWQRKLNRDRPPRSDKAQNAALNTLKGQLDTWLETKFNTDMISGDPDALRVWRNARDATRRYKEKFEDDKIIAQFARKDATPAEIRQWIFGASSVGAKKEALRTVEKLKEMAGANSPEFRALRHDALFDVMEPLFKDEPSLRGFVTKYDNFVQRNSDVAESLMGDSFGELKNLRDIAATALKRGDPPSMDGLLLRALSVFSVGHGIAMGALRVTGMQKVGRALKEATNKDQFLREMFGAQVDDPMLARIMKAGAAAQGAKELREEQSPRGSAM